MLRFQCLITILATSFVLSACDGNGPLSNQAVSFSRTHNLIAENGTPIACENEATISTTAVAYICLYEKPGFQGQACCVDWSSRNYLTVPAENPRSISTGSIRNVTAPGLFFCSANFALPAEAEQCTANPSGANCPKTPWTCFGMNHIRDINPTPYNSSTSSNFGVKKIFQL